MVHEMKITKSFILFILSLIICPQYIKAQTINIGPNQKITANMKFVEVCRALNQFWLYTACEETKKFNPESEHEQIMIPYYGWFHNTIPSLKKTLENEKISFKEKKKVLLKYYAPTIKYIEEIYSQPISLLEKKCISKQKQKRYDISGIFDTTYLKYKYCCTWHARVLAQRGSAIAQYVLGMYRAGGNDEEAIEWLKLAAASGITNAYHYLAVLCSRKKLYTEEILFSKKGAELQDVPCMYNLGCLYKETGRYSDALYWFEKVAERGSIYAINQCIEISRFKYSPGPQKTIKYYQWAIKYDEKMKKTNKKYEDNIAHYKSQIEQLKLQIED